MAATAARAARPTNTDWRGPSTHEMIATHTLAEQVMANADAACPVFDDAQLARLRRFCFCEDPGARAALLAEWDMADGAGAAPGTRANAVHGSLVGYIAATYGTGRAAMTEGEVEQLRRWFAATGRGGDV